MAADADLTGGFGKLDGSTDNDGNAASFDGNGNGVPLAPPCTRRSKART